jgi:hypothetical protein
VDSHVTLARPAEPYDGLLDGCYLRVEGRLLAGEVTRALGDGRALALVVLRDYPAESSGFVAVKLNSLLNS